jgi:glutamate 5-kinase
MRAVVKIGSSSVTTGQGEINEAALAKLCSEVATALGLGWEVILVSSGAIAAGRAELRRNSGSHRDVDSGDGGLLEYQEEPASSAGEDLVSLQALAAVGQSVLIRAYQEAFGSLGLTSGQVLLSPLDFFDRRQYLRARSTLERLLAMGAVPIVNENDAVCDDEIRMGDNDRLSALVAHLVKADVLVLLTDAPGLLDVPPGSGREGNLIEEVIQVDRELIALAGGPGSRMGSGGMATKLAACSIAAWSGIRSVIASASRAEVLQGALQGIQGVGTVVHPRPRRLPARKLWIAFALAPAGRLRVDQGAFKALVKASHSLLPAGVLGCEGAFEAGDAVEVENEEGRVFAKGLVRMSSAEVAKWAGKHSSELPSDVSDVVVQRDDLVVLEPE